MTVHKSVETICGNTVSDLYSLSLSDITHALFETKLEISSKEKKGKTDDVKHIVLLHKLSIVSPCRPKCVCFKSMF